MFSVQEYRFAQKYSFSDTARKIVKDSKLDLENIPPQVVSRAIAMVSAAFSGHAYNPRIENSTELMANEILAYPVAKIIVSLIDRYELYRRFCAMVSEAVVKNLEQEKDEVLFDMANEMGVKINLPEEKFFFVKLSIQDYLKNGFEDLSMKLVNRSVESGFVFLNRNEFVRFIASVVSSNLRDSFPLKISKPPLVLLDAAQELEKEFASTVRKKFSKADFGEIKPEFFPPCMAKIYSDLDAGINANHYARFAIAAFLASIGMNAEHIIGVFRQTPNFNERTTRYQVERIAGVKGSSYSSPSCDKMRSYSLCVSNCPVSNPIRFYSNEISRSAPAEKSSKTTE